MRDLLAVAWQQRRAIGADAGATPPSQGFRRRRRSRFLSASLLLLVGVGLGALPFTLEWSGKRSRDLSHEQVMQMVKGTSLNPNQRGTLITMLSGHAGEGLSEIRRLKALGGAIAVKMRAALDRIEIATTSGKLHRSDARRYPAWIDYGHAMDRLRSTKSASEEPWDCLEVVVYNIEESILVFSQWQSAPGDLGLRAKAALTKLRRQLDAR